MVKMYSSNTFAVIITSCSTSLAELVLLMGKCKRQIWSDTDTDADTDNFKIHFYIYTTLIFHT